MKGAAGGQEVTGKGLRAKSFQQKLQNKSVGRGETFLQTFLMIMSSNFRYQTFVAVSGNPGGKVPVVDDVLSSHEQEIYPTTSVDENCIEFEFQTDRNYYVDLRQTYLALKLKFVRDRCYENHNTKGVKKRAQRRGKSRRGRDGGRETSFSRYSCKQPIALNFFQC